MATLPGRQFRRGFWLTSLGTLVGRVLGLVRDMATAALLGLEQGGVMDALVVAFRVPNLLRRIFGEGALAASLLPVFSAEYQRDRRRAWQLVSVLFIWLAIGLSAIVLVGEGVLAAIYFLGNPDARTLELVTLAATMLPYLIFICLAAQAAATLQALLRFGWPALAPMLLNVCWLAAVWGVAPALAPDKLAQAHVIAVSVLVSGVLQFVVQLPALRAVGFRFDYNWRASRDAVWQVGRSMLPITLGLAITQFNTLLDSLIAWGLSAEAGSTQTIWWLGGVTHYPLRSGAAAAVYYGERFYLLPVGVLGLAVATVIYPLVSRHAARGQRDQVGSVLTLGLRLVWFAALPAAIGIMLTARPVVRLLFERGEFTPDDAVRAADMIATYATGIWAYCAIPVLVRGYWAAGDRMTPARVGLIAVGLNLLANLVLIWPLAERGLAVSTSVAAMVQVALLAFLFSRTGSRLAWHELRSTLVKGAVASAVMGLSVSLLMAAMLNQDFASRGQLALELAAVIAAGIVVYLVAAWLLGMREPAVLLSRRSDAA